MLEKSQFFVELFESDDMPPRLYASIDSVVCDFLVLVTQRPVVVTEGVALFAEGTVSLGELAISGKEVSVAVG